VVAVAAGLQAASVLSYIARALYCIGSPNPARVPTDEVRNPMSADWRVFALGSAFFAALTAIFGKVGVSEINSDLATFLRTLVILLIAALLVCARHEWQRPDSLSVKGVLFLVLSGAATGLSWLCYYRALQTGPASRVAPIDKLSVIFVVLFAVSFLGERLTWKVGLGGLLIATGAVLMAL
jgi:transporter family protein